MPSPPSPKSTSQRINDKVGVISIGPAGEMQMLAANISVKDPDNHVRSCGRGGLGAVMGSKRIKFIAVEPTDKKVEIAEPEAFKAANRAFAKALVDNPISKALAQYGTNVLVNIINESGGLPTRNLSTPASMATPKATGISMESTPMSSMIESASATWSRLSMAQSAPSAQMVSYSKPEVL